MLANARGARNLSLRALRQSRAPNSLQFRNTAIATPPVLRKFSSTTGDDDDAKSKRQKMPGIFGRLLSPDSSGQNAILRALGYYSAESRAIGAGNALYKQSLKRAASAAIAEGGEDPSFVARFEMLAVHIYLTLRRLRVEKGSIHENDVKTAMQCIFDILWTDVRTRMIMKENNMGLVASGKWIKECERMFFGMAIAFDEGWGDEQKMRESISRNITCLNQTELRVERFRRYMIKERSRLEKASIEDILGGTCWDDNYPLAPAI